ncbi:MAG: proline--tRNA ligase [Planctomycetota bacterium]|nr:proline--tRNA ligase [Planctomycetota bacterium]
MKLSRTLFATLREVPSDTEVASHALMARAGFIHKLAAGIYVYGPMMWRVLRRVEGIVRDEHDRVDCQEMLMPAVQPKELWAESGRWDRYVNDGILFHFHDRRGSEVCLGPTHEEVVTDFVRSRVQSWRQLPVILYQIQTKFRDEIRPRFGLMRGREFIMKDAYSFDVSEEAMKQSYATMREVYRAVFTRCGLRFTPVQADSGAIGGCGSEEFMVDADSGEDAIAVCRVSGYAANIEKAVSIIPPPPAAPASVLMHKEATPGARSCEDLLRMFPDLPLARMLKTVIYQASWGDRQQTVAVMCRGDRQLNEVKILNHLGALKLELADEAVVRAATGAAVGFAGPIGLKDGVRLLADASVEGVQGFLCGGNETDTHWLDAWFGRDLAQPETADFGLVQAGDATVDGGGAIEITRGIEVGHIFQLGTKYSEAMQATYNDEQQKKQPIWMGCYGIGVSRIAAAAIEQNHDENGMIWPLPIAPYAVLLVHMKPGDEAQDALAQELHDALEAQGVDVLWDDRPKVSPGAKFKDADLVGVPLRIVVGRDAAQRGVEWSERARPGEKEALSAEAARDRAVELCRAAGRRA